MKKFKLLGFSDRSHLPEGETRDLELWSSWIGGFPVIATETTYIAVFTVIVNGHKFSLDHFVYEEIV